MQTKVFFLVLFAVVACALAAGGNGNSNGNGNYRRNGNGNGGGRSGQGYEGRELQGRGSYQGRDRQGYRGQDDYRRYRSNLYNDDDVYGYDANYPNGEAAYINYRSKDARSRRGPEFERISRAYSRQGEGGQGYQNPFGLGNLGQNLFGRNGFGQPGNY